MPVAPYGVLVARVVDSRREESGDSPHYQVHVRDEAGADYRIAINVLSAESPSELLYLLDDDFHHPLTDTLGQLGSGWHPLESRPGSGSLDYIRGNLLDKGQMRVLPPHQEGPDNDLADVFDHFVSRAKADPGARVFAFGERWGPEPDKPDKIFGFSPGAGVHDIHMNQGNGAEFAKDNGVWQDGGLLFHFPSENRWVAVLLAFQGQAWHTDDATGDPIGGGPAVESFFARARILAASVNPTGTPEDEWVLLINASADDVDLTGWTILNKLKDRAPVPGVVLNPGQTLVVRLEGKAPLSNQGGAITILNAADLKVHGVAYTRLAARREGWTVTF